MNKLLEVKNISKSFPGTKALDDITFDVNPGEVHILLGENGAGKSTLMKILSGVLKPDCGQIILNGKTFSSLTPVESFENGISMIYQELSVIDTLSIEENIFIGRLPTKKMAGISVIDRASIRKRTKELLQEIGLNKKPDTPVENLSIAEKQMVEICKAVAFNANVIIMDEPTSSQTGEEVKRLFSIIRNLKSAGKCIIYISHKLDELKQIGDRVTVLKDGKCVGTKNIAEVTIESLITMMVGRELSEKYTKQHSEHASSKVPLLEVTGLTRRDEYIKDINFTLYKGEVLGFSGLDGAGRTELMEALFGAVPIKSGVIKIEGKTIRNRSPYEAIRHGMAMVTENRRETGFFDNFSIKKNISIVKQIRDSRCGGLIGLINYKEENTLAAEAQSSLSIRCADLEQNITELSGGNQQKVIFGKWNSTDQKIVIFDEPTRGIDVGTKAEIYKIILRLAEKGIGVLVVSSELPELLGICDRILVMNTGVISGEFAIENATEENLVRAATMSV